jgi:OmpA family
MFRSTHRLMQIVTTLTLSFQAAATSPINPQTGIESKASIQPIYIDFRPGHPITGESLSEATSYSTAALNEVLQGAVDAINKTPEMAAEVIGFTDDQECIDRECHDLSMRRAQCVYDWMIARGVSPRKLRGPNAAGDAWPLDVSNTEKGRSYNRRVQLNPFLIRASSEK